MRLRVIQQASSGPVQAEPWLPIVWESCPVAHPCLDLSRLYVGSTDVCEAEIAAARRS